MISAVRFLIFAEEKFNEKKSHQKPHHFGTTIIRHLGKLLCRIYDTLLMKERAKVVSKHFYNDNKK